MLRNSCTDPYLFVFASLCSAGGTEEVGGGEREEVSGGEGDQVDRGLPSYRKAGGAAAHPRQLRETLSLHQSHRTNTESSSLGRYL